MMGNKINIEINGVVKEVEAINLGGSNYVKLRDLADSRIKVSYDAERKLPIVRVE